MKAKRFILMMLVMLGSMSGAWAEDTGEFSWNCPASYDGTGSGPINYSDGDINIYFPDSQPVYGMSSIGGSYFQLGNLNGAVLTTNNQCKITSISIIGLRNRTDIDWNILCHHQNGSSISNAHKESDLNAETTVFTFSEPVEYVKFSCLNGYGVAQFSVTYDYPKHTHNYENLEHDGTKHWWTCNNNIGLCKENKKTEQHVYSSDRNDGAAYYTCSVCGYEDLYRKHHHVAADAWSYNANQHWHACHETVGQCDANGKLDIANHTYGSSMYGEDASAYYTCDICGYVNNTRKAQYDALDFLSMKAVGAPMTIGMAKTGSPANYDLQYSLDRTHWTSVALTATNSNIVEIPDGQTCYFRHGTETAIDRISSHQSNLWTFIMTGDGSVEAGGNVMSLLDITCQKNTLSVQHVFNSLFKGCAKLTKAPKLPATSLGEYCYWSMFEGTSITEVPELPATSVRTGSYLSMFKDCKQLTCITGGNVLSFTSLAGRACKEMFMGCENLTAVTLNNITSMDSRNNSDASFYNWLEGTAIDTEGVLIAPDALVANPLIFLPQNWMFKQIKDYTTAVSNATEGTASVVQKIGEDYITQIKQATDNASALGLRDEALSDINTLRKYNSKLDASSFAQPTGAGMRLKVTKKDGNVYEFKTSEVESVDYYRVNE